MNIIIIITNDCKLSNSVLTNICIEQESCGRFKPIRSALIHGICLFEDGIGVARRQPVARASLRSSQSSIMSFRGVKRRGNPLNRNKNRLTIATNRISPRAYYRAENLYYQFEQGQELLPQLRQIICLVEVGRDTHTRLE